MVPSKRWSAKPKVQTRAKVETSQPRLPSVPSTRSALSSISSDNAKPVKMRTSTTISEALAIKYQKFVQKPKSVSMACAWRYWIAQKTLIESSATHRQIVLQKLTYVSPISVLIRKTSSRSCQRPKRLTLSWLKRTIWFAKRRWGSSSREEWKISKGSRN